MSEDGRPREHAKDVEDVVVPAGKFRIYLGSVAGVGKTCAMLDEGWRRSQRGRDVVIGFVEAHGRPKTLELMKDLEVIPRRTATHRGTTFEEMDVDAVIERHPDLALIDELAHTNVPQASRHEKRWEDVLEILDAGIAVISTLNVQHIESIADAVEAITEAKVRERVPDWVVRRADQVELIDSSPEQLRRRMLHGNIYPPAKIEAALQGFFKTQNLVALRELALRFVADEAEEDLLEYLREHTASHVWETTERVMATVTGEPSDEAVVHRAARIASRLKTTLEVVLVAEGERTSRRAERLDALKRVATDVGAATTELTADDVAESVVDLATQHQITQLVLSAPPPGRLVGLRRSSKLVRLLPLAAANGIDVHLIAPQRADSDGR
ncbi:MAG TPA: sensor histidine kinase KdpD [Acidimicrobiales bacterium]|nr:sensor histidine kinase KdpD [Acidimicrobiales bacterium]